MNTFSSHLVRKRVEGHPHRGSAAELGGLEPADDVLQRGGDHEVLLLQTQLLPLEKLQNTNRFTASIKEHAETS